MTNHTPEPWHVEPGPTIIGSSEDFLGMPNKVARLNLTLGHYESEEANARRIVACVNACEGVPNDALDGGWEAAGLSAYAKRLEVDLAAVTAQRDELLAALKIVTTGTVGDILERLHEFHALVAKCEAKP